MTQARPICVIGNANIDLVAGSIDDWPSWGTEIFLNRSDFRIGGSAANTALVLGRMNVEAGLISATGNDTVGALISSQFSKPQDRVAMRPQSTSISVGILKTGGERSFFSTTGHLDFLDAAFFQNALEDWPLEGALAVVSGGFAMPALQEQHTALLHWLKAKGAETAIDPGWPGENWSQQEIALAHDWIAASDHILFNEMEIMGLTGERDVDDAISRLCPTLAPGASLIVKQGPQGASLWRSGRLDRASANPVEVIDTVGAGDAFNAGYIGAVAHGLKGQEALATGISVASEVIAEFPRGSGPVSSNFGGAGA